MPLQSADALVTGYGLDPDFAKNLAALLATCKAKGYDFRISQGTRSPQTQAKYYCSWAKRPPAAIDAAAKSLRDAGAPWLAGLLSALRDMPRRPDWLTGQLPGGGWHQWGLAADCYCYRNGKMVESGSDPCYKFYAEEATKLGLTAGYYFSHQDSGHVQSRPEPGASDIYGWSYIDKEMKARFSDKDAVALSKDASPDILHAADAETVAAIAPASKAAGAAPSRYKDDPTLIAAPLKPDLRYKLPTANGILKSLARTYNDVGGLIETLASATGIDPVAVLAVWYVESGGRAFTPDLPVLRFEVHKFFAFWGSAHQAAFDQHFQFGGHAGVPGKSHKNHRFRVKPTDAWLPVHVDDQTREYDAFRFAQSLADKEAACTSSSFGGPQIMGFNASACGYGSASALADAFGADQRWQVLGFFDFCASRGLIDEIKAQSWVRFGALYNGDGPTYGPLLKNAFDNKDALLALPKVQNSAAAVAATAAAPAGAKAMPAAGLPAKGYPKRTKLRLDSATLRPEIE